MKSKFIEQLKQLKPTSREEIKAALEKGRSQHAGVVAFEADVLRPVQGYADTRKFSAKA